MSKKIKNTRDEINIILKEMNISDDEFFPVRFPRYKDILSSMFVKFTGEKLEKINCWWWDFFYEPVDYFTPDNTLQVLSELIQTNDNLWFMFDDESKKQEHFWLYEGKMHHFLKVIAELPFMEYYIAPKNLKWIICENHHNTLILSGEQMVSKLKTMKEKEVN